MRKSLSLLPLMAVSASGCATAVDPAGSGMKYRVSYTDTDRDGFVDRAEYRSRHFADADYFFADSDHDGRYDRVTRSGIAIQSKPVDVPVYLDPGKSRLNKTFLQFP